MKSNEQRLMREMGRAIHDFDLISEGDRIMVGVSGGKDSFTLLSLLMKNQQIAPIRYELVAVNLDQGHPGFPADTLRQYLESVGVEHRMLKQDTYSIVKSLVPEGKTYCPVCSRLRRGILYNAAVELGCNKIALGHHRDDLIETLLLSAFYSGSLKSMPPKLHSDDGRNVVIRPLAYCPEETIRAYAEEMRFPIIPCDLCGSQENLKRKKVKRLIAELAGENPAVKGNLLNALANVVPSHLLDPRLARVQTGKDPWLDEDEADGGCAAAEKTQNMLAALRTPGARAPDGIER
ncbi:MAG: tRNA 2-thiocytidine(32) synthetase TtcA [Myxococcales bacterium]